MTRSRLRKLKQFQLVEHSQVARAGLPIASALLILSPAAYAQQADTAAGAGGATLEEIVVTATKRSENLQNVPISIQALGTEKLEQLHVTDFSDYAQFLPTVSFQSAGPGFSHAYMRGVAASNNINHSGPSPSVGVYLDEQPVTTIDGELDIHIYDIERVETLAGPQGTLYGASSQAGTIRIITNKPDPSAFKAGYDVGVNTVAHGGIGYVGEGFVNLPLSPSAAIRLVGWDEHKAGYIDNVPGTIVWTPPASNVATNAPFVKNDYNDATTKGARGALKIDLNDQWTITPTVMGQVQDSHGFFGFNPALGDLKVQHFLPEYQHDSWVQTALTVEGKISNFDIVYAGAYLNRNTHTASDYTDYSIFYDTPTTGAYFKDNAGNIINPDQLILGIDNYTHLSQELRISTPKENRVRFVGGLFYQRQVHEILQDYVIPNLATSLSVQGWPNTWWLTDQERKDTDEAIFGELTFDVTDKLAATVGDRYFKSINSLAGFYGFAAGGPFASSEGEATCAVPFVPFHGAPCQDLNGPNIRTNASGNSPKVNLTYKFDADHMMYATFSKGFRPGGVNRAGGGSIPPYKPDFLTNYEIGWKTTWLAKSLRWNGAVFREDWKDFQFSFLGPNSLTIVANAGQAQILGMESDLEWAATNNLTLSAGLSYLDAQLKQNYCGEAQCTTPEAPYGTQLPVTPKFKEDLTARYTFDWAGFKGHLQLAAVYVGDRWADLRSAEYHDHTDANGNVTSISYLGNPRGILGQEKAYTTVDVSAGLEKHGFSYELYINNVADTRAQLDNFAECEAVKCGQTTDYILPNQPRTIGLRFGQKF